jgi:hypothetical protein
MTEIDKSVMHVWRYDHGAVLELSRRPVTHSASVNSSGQAFLAPHSWQTDLSSAVWTAFSWWRNRIRKLFPSNTGADVSNLCLVRLRKWETVSRCLGSGETQLPRKSSAIRVEANFASLWL